VDKCPQDYELRKISGILLPLLYGVPESQDISVVESDEPTVVAGKDDAWSTSHTEDVAIIEIGMARDQ
jgi:hypothetical protein